jgi:CDP-diacylglycerol--glycerol-3-phosphate 3-phosphatidyltransferase
MVFIILAREMAITGLRGIASEEGITIAADTMGKWKMGAQIASISCLILGPQLDTWMYQWTRFEVFQFFIQLNKPYSFFVGMGVLLLWAAMILALWSAVSYFRKFWKMLGNSILTGKGKLTHQDSPSQPLDKQ